MKALSLVLDFQHALDRGAGYLYSFARSKVFTPFFNSVLSIVLLTRLTGFYTGPDSYLIYFVGPLGGNTSLVKMENIFKRASARTLNGVPVKFEEIDDAGDPALARTIAKVEHLVFVAVDFDGHIAADHRRVFRHAGLHEASGFPRRAKGTGQPFIQARRPCAATLIER